MVLGDNISLPQPKKVISTPAKEAASIAKDKWKKFKIKKIKKVQVYQSTEPI